MRKPMHTKALLGDLISFNTVSSQSNLALITYCADLLEEAGAQVTIIEDGHEAKANLYATVGPEEVPGVLLSGHTDVVPVEGQNWSVAPFEMSEHDGKLYGRGATDMKGFVASALAIVLHAAQRDLTTPLHLALSYDEEVGCLGVRSMLDMLRNAPFRPRFCIVGEPTMMSVATGHKGKVVCKLTCLGKEAHSALAPTGLNAIHLASDMIAFMRDLQAELAASSRQDEDYDVPYTTLHVGRIAGGVALNIVPNLAYVDFEIRNLPQDDPKAILRRIEDQAKQLVEPFRRDFPEASIDLELVNSYPPLDTDGDAEVVKFVQSLTRANATSKVAFGTEGGLFSTELGVPTVICGPGSMAQGHKPDEYISEDQLAQCDAMLNTLLDRLIVGI